jgi:hypothetical protein
MSLATPEKIRILRRKLYRKAKAARHEVAGGGTKRFSYDVVYGERGLLRLERLPLTAPSCASRRSQSESRMR